MEMKCFTHLLCRAVKITFRCTRDAVTQAWQDGSVSMQNEHNALYHFAIKEDSVGFKAQFVELWCYISGPGDPGTSKLIVYGLICGSCFRFWFVCLFVSRIRGKTTGRILTKFLGRLEKSNNLVYEIHMTGWIHKLCFTFINVHTHTSFCLLVQYML